MIGGDTLSIHVYLMLLTYIIIGLLLASLSKHAIDLESRSINQLCKCTILTLILTEIMHDSESRLVRALAKLSFNTEAIAHSKIDRRCLFRRRISQIENCYE